METNNSSDPTQDHQPRRSPAHRVVGVAAGEAHTLMLTGSGEVYSWGRGTFGRLGTGTHIDHCFPVHLHFHQPINFVGVAAGAYHSLSLGDDGSIWSWGYNTYGQLGFDGEDVSLPRRLDRFIELDSSRSLGDDTEVATPLKVSTIKAGAMMSLAIDNLGTLWIWGNCPQPSTSTDSDGSFSLTSITTPVPVWDFHGHTVVKVACGNEHVVALVTTGETYKGNDLVCYSWGGNKHGQLGLGDTNSRSHPQAITMFNEGSIWSPYEVACGAFHSVVLATKRKPSDTLESVCWTFGQGENGELGHGTTQNVLLPEPVEELPKNAYFVSVDCGLFHTSVVSSLGEVWSWGMEKGLGLCPDASFTGTDPGNALLPLLIPCNEQYGPKFLDPVQITCGAAHTILVGDAGYKLWSWGRGRSGVLGDGKMTDSYSPTVVLWPPLSEDFKDESLSTSKDSKNQKNEDEEGEISEEMKLLQSKLMAMERYASILHGSMFGKPLEERDIPSSLCESGTFDVAKEWENMLEMADGGKLKRLEMLYRNMLAGVKDKILKRRIQEIVQECMQSSTARDR